MTEHDLNCTLAPDLKKKKKNPFYSNPTSAKTATPHGSVNPSPASRGSSPRAPVGPRRARHDLPASPEASHRGQVLTTVSFTRQKKEGRFHGGGGSSARLVHVCLPWLLAQCESRTLLLLGILLNAAWF